jgi:hypothetical protein
MGERGSVGLQVRKNGGLRGEEGRGRDSSREIGLGRVRNPLRFVLEVLSCRHGWLTF